MEIAAVGNIKDPIPLGIGRAVHDEVSGYELRQHGDDVRGKGVGAPERVQILQKVEEGSEVLPAQAFHMLRYLLLPQP
jgi:hypothetical protein